MKNQNQYDATPSALGYIYQVRFALLLALQKVYEAEDPDNCFISIEKLDDIAFEENGTPSELLQAKFHGNPGNLTDRSEDLWKTLRIWSEMYVCKENLYEDTVFTILTTESAGKNSIASFLGTDLEHRNVDAALERMLVISEETTNQTNIKGYQAFSALENWQQKKLLNSVYVISNTPDIIQVVTEIKKKIRMSASPHHIDPFFSRLEGRWFARAIEAMSIEGKSNISIIELVDIVDDLRNQFLPGNLPSDFDDAFPDIIDINNDDRVFIEQLRLIGASNKVLNQAILNYYRAFEQRSRWSRENLVKPGELKKYMNQLKSEWEHHSSLIELTNDFEKEENLKLVGLKTFSKCQNDGAIPIRTEFKYPYVARGTYHSLSDKLEIGWHPEYETLLQPAKDKGVA